MAQAHCHPVSICHDFGFTKNMQQRFGDPMRIHILPDLHTEFAPYTPDPAADGADVVLLAGDIG